MFFRCSIQLTISRQIVRVHRCRPPSPRAHAVPAGATPTRAEQAHAPGSALRARRRGGAVESVASPARRVPSAEVAHATEAQPFACAPVGRRPSGRGPGTRAGSTATRRSALAELEVSHTQCVQRASPRRHVGQRRRDASGRRGGDPTPATGSETRGRVERRGITSRARVVATLVPIDRRIQCRRPRVPSHERSPGRS